MCLYIWLRGFFVQSLQSGGGAGLEPLVVHRDRVVLDACAGALSRGVEPGMSLGEAKQLLSDGRFVAFRRERFDSARDRMLSICLEASSGVEPDDVHSAWLDLSGHPQPSFVAGRLIESLMDAGFDPYAAIARAKWVAKRFSIHATSARNRLILEDEQLLCALPTHYLDPIDPDVREELILMGYHRVCDVRRLPIARLQSLFGRDRGLCIFEASRGRGNTVVRPLYPSRSVFAQLYFEPPISDRTQIHFAHTQIARELCRQLSQRNLCGSELIGYWEDETWKCLRFARRLARDYRDHRALLVIMNQLTEATAPSSPLISIRWMMPSLRAVEPQQLSIFCNESNRFHDFSLHALSKLRARFGEDSIRLASNLEQPRRLRLLRAWHYPMKLIFPNRARDTDGYSS